MQLSVTTNVIWRSLESKRQLKLFELLSYIKPAVTMAASKHSIAGNPLSAKRGTHKMRPVSLTREGSVSVVTIDNPPVNALSQSVREGLLACFGEATDDGATDSIVLCCSGRTFVAGADIREFGRPPAAPHLPDVIDAIERSDKPVLAAIHGTALGGGLELALGCHYRMATDSAALGFPEVKLGLLPGASGTQRTPRIAGADFALKMMLSGEPVQAGEALDAGIVDRLCRDELQAEAIAWAGQLASQGPRRIRNLPRPEVAREVIEKHRAAIARKARGLMSPEKILKCVELAAEVDFESACLAEREFFLECRDSPQSRGLRHAFFAERAVSRVPGIGKDTGRRAINKVAILGAGTMGTGIAYACLAGDFEVYLQDSAGRVLTGAAARIRKLFDAGIERGQLQPADRDAGLRRFSCGTDPGDVADADLVIEAVVENLAVKQEVFRGLDAACKTGAVLASNTSTLDIDAIAAATDRPADVIGLHFFSPAHIMRLLEIVRGHDTSPDVIATALEFAKRLGKTGVVVGNCYGFVGNRMLYCYGRENQFLLLEGAAPEFIDQVLYDWGMAMGPNAVGDLAGLDVGYKARRERADKPDDLRFYRIADLLVESGRLGQKTGSGMFRYPDGGRLPVADPEVQAMIEAEATRLGIARRRISAQEIIERCIYALIVEGARILEDGIAARAGDIDVIWINGYGFPRHRGGPMHHADTLGLDQVYGTVCEFRDRFGAQYWEPPELLRKLARDNARFADLDD